MRQLRNILLLPLAFAFLSARGGHVAETLSLSAGWNAVYLESTPDASAPSDFFADLPQVERVGCYESSVYSSLAQIASDGTSIAQKPAAFLVWERGKESDSTLGEMLGGRVYLVYSSAAAGKSFYGRPCCPQTSWQKADSGFATIAGVSIPAGETVSSLVYFGEGPLGLEAAKKPHAVGGESAVAPEFTLMTSFRGSPTLKGGAAYALEGEAVADWPGVVKVTVPSSSGVLAFKSGVSLQSMEIANAGRTNRTLRVSCAPGELAGERLPPMQIFLKATGTSAAKWIPFDTHDFELAPGESRQIVLSVDMTQIDPAGGEYAALVAVSDLSGTKMRVRVPVTVSAEPESEGSAAYPKGLWYGNVEVSQVDQMCDGVPVKAGGSMRLNAMVFIGADGVPKLMQRVNAGTRRISCVFPDIAHNALPATSGTFGELLQFDWTVAEDAKDNPFRHSWHPDHAKGFAVTNRLSLSWRTEGGESTWKYTPEEVTYGICTWTLGGLSGAGEIKTRGTFALKRILTVSQIEE